MTNFDSHYYFYDDYCHYFCCYYHFHYCHCHHYFFIFNSFNFYCSSFCHILYLCTNQIFLNFSMWRGRTFFKGGSKNPKTILVMQFWCLWWDSTCWLIYSFDDLLLKWHYYLFPLAISSFILYLFFDLDLLCCCVICTFACKLKFYFTLAHWQSFLKEEKYL